MLNITKLVKSLERKKWQTVLLLCALFTPINMVYAGAAAPASAESKWNAVIGFLLPWISRLGGVVILLGAIEFGLAFKNDDAEGKTKGMRTVIAGCIVVGVGLSSSTFLY